MSPLVLYTYVVAAAAAGRARRRLHLDERGEGVISAAVAVLIMAVLAAAMWVVFDRMFTNTTADTEDKVREIGR